MRPIALLVAAVAASTAACAPYVASAAGGKNPPPVTQRTPAEAGVGQGTPTAAPAPAPPLRGPIDHGSTVVAGGVAFSSAGGELNQDASGHRLVIFELHPDVLHFVARGFALGVALSLTSAAQGSASATSLGVGPKAAYFFGPRQPAAHARGALYPFVAFSLLATRQSVSTGFADATGTGVTAAFDAGLTYLMTESVGLVAQTGYRIDNLKVEGQSASGNSITIQLGIAGFLR